jgi:hypothetical protein
MTKFPSASIGGRVPSGSSLAVTKPAVFGSRASNLVRPDRNNQQDVFQRDLATDETTRIAADRRGQFPVDAVDMTPDSRYVALVTRADLLPEENVGFFASDVYVLRNR